MLARATEGRIGAGSECASGIARSSATRLTKKSQVAIGTLFQVGWGRKEAREVDSLGYVAKRSSSSDRRSDDFFLDEEADWDEVTTESEQLGYEAEDSAGTSARPGQRTLGGDLGNLENRVKASWAGLSVGGKRAVVAAAAALIAVIVVVVVLAARGGDETAPAEATPAEATAPAAAEEATVLPADETGTGDAAAGDPAEATGDGGGTGTATGGATSSGVSEEVTLRLGDQGENVRELQLALNDLGYNAGEADGVFGQTTQNAVVAFQSDAGLSADGVVGPQTAAAINNALAELP